MRFYRARDTKLKRDVAIKVLPQEFSGHEDRVSRFQREAEVLASLSHPNIAAIFDLPEGGGIKYLVLELVEGERSPIGLRWNLLATAYGLPSRRNYSPAFDCQPELLQDHAVGSITRSVAYIHPTGSGTAGVRFDPREAGMVHRRNEEIVVYGK